MICLYRLVTKSLKLDNRVLFGAAVLGTLTGVVLMGDWQAIGGDPCSSDNMSPENGSGMGLEYYYDNTTGYCSYKKMCADENTSLSCLL